MQLSKNSVIELWYELSNIPTVTNETMATVIDEDFLGWPAGTDVEEIWHWFDDQFAKFGGVHVLMYEDPQPERKFRVSTPNGIIEVYAKHEKDDARNFPGIYVDIRHNKRQLAGKQIGDLVAAVEYDSTTGNFQTVTYRPEKDEPDNVEVYDYKEESTSLSELKAAYEKFKLAWMISHDIKLDDIYKLVQEFIEESKIDSDFAGKPLEAILSLQEKSTSNNFKSYLEKHGFGGMLWPSFEKWLESGECKSVMTYGDFISEYDPEIKVLDAYDENGNAIVCPDEDIPLNAVVMSFNRLCGCFEITVRLPKEAADAN